MVFSRISVLAVTVALAALFATTTLAATSSPGSSNPPLGYTLVKAPKGTPTGTKVLRPPAMINCGDALWAGVDLVKNGGTEVLANAGTSPGTAGLFNHQFNPSITQTQYRTPPKQISGQACGSNIYLQYIFEGKNRVVASYQVLVGPSPNPLPAAIPPGYSLSQALATSNKSNVAPAPTTGVTQLLTPPTSIPCVTPLSAGVNVTTFPTGTSLAVIQTTAQAGSNTMYSHAFYVWNSDLGDLQVLPGNSYYVGDLCGKTQSLNYLVDYYSNTTGLGNPKYSYTAKYSFNVDAQK